MDTARGFIIGLLIGIAIGYGYCDGQHSKSIPLKKVKVIATAYNSEVGQCDSSPFITASGTKCRKGVIACNFLPIGTKVWIKGMGKNAFIVEDRMHPRFSQRIDIWFADKKEAIKFGKRSILIAYKGAD